MLVDHLKGSVGPVAGPYWPALAAVRGIDNHNAQVAAAHVQPTCQCPADTVSTIALSRSTHLGATTVFRPEEGGDKGA